MTAGKLLAKENADTLYANQPQTLTNVVGRFSLTFSSIGIFQSHLNCLDHFLYVPYSSWKEIEQHQRLFVIVLPLLFVSAFVTIVHIYYILICYI